jgi:hypothetical protein
VKSQYTFIYGQQLGKHFRGNEYASNNPVTYIISNSLCFLRGPCKVVIKKKSVEKNIVEFRDASLLGAEELNLIESSELSVSG